ncbi:ATP-binding protein [Candidatus Magnetominusculus xianensis]|nr:ATP-binding protein [Candidatus Magnetominusculus xianensis]MBF0402449.1 HAMP domain-containing protein [Nitrospirota bacterium]
MSSHVTADEMEHLEFIAKTMSLRINDGIARKKSILQRISEGREVDVYVERYHELLLSQYFTKFSKEFPVLSYVNARAEEEVTVVNAGAASGNRDIGDTTQILSQLAANTSKPDKIIISNAQYNAMLGVPAVTFAIPKYSFFGDQLIGFIMGVSPISDITKCLSDVEVAEDGFILLLDDNKNIIYHNTHHSIGKLIEKAGASYDFPIKPASMSKGILRTSVLGIDSIAAYFPIEETRWQLLVVMPYEGFISEARKTIYSTVVILIIVLAASGVIFTLITNNITNNISNPLKRFISFTDMIAKGNYSQVTGINSTDEIGVLAKSFNNMLIELDKTQQARNEHLEELKEINEYLKQSQAQLVQAEKMASLGQLVAGVAHEINTPVGIAYTLSSSIVKSTEAISSAFNDKSLNRSQLGKYITEVEQGNQLIFNNLHRTADLIKSFKMVSADQLTQDRRRFNLEDYIGEILFTLQPKTKKYQHNIEVSCSKDLTLDSYPGAFAQIITNLLMNSLIHAYDPGEKGTITISAIPKGDEIIVEYKDDGKGIPEEDLKHIFDPFFTTRRGAGGMGLGLHIVFNTVTQTLGGRMECKSTLGKGTAFIINVPVRTEGTA